MSALRWTTRSVTVQLGDEGRQLLACSDGSWLLSNVASACVAAGQARGGIAAAKRAAVAAARSRGWMADDITPHGMHDVHFDTHRERNS